MHNNINNSGAITQMTTFYVTTAVTLPLSIGPVSVSQKSSIKIAKWTELVSGTETILGLSYTHHTHTPV